MDGPSVEHSDSDSGESWTLLENASIYADEPPEFIEDPEKNGAQQHHDKDEDTDGISIISDSDHDHHDASSPTPEDGIYEKCQIQEKHIAEKDISDYVSIDPHLPDIDDNHRDPPISEDFLGDTHTRHKTYVHRRNKRLSTMLNIIVLGSVITAAGVAIGHMWGAKHDCTMQTTTSVNKILSNLYKLQEENAYLRSKLIELTNVNKVHIQDKTPLKHMKCKKVFEESLSNYKPRKLTKCVDDNYNNADDLVNHNIKPKFEKEFVADIDKLKTVYLQNKSWLDDEISRRLKIEEELLKKYNDEVNSAKEQKKEPVGINNEVVLEVTDFNDYKEETIKKSKNTEHKIKNNEAGFKMSDFHIHKKEKVENFKIIEKENLVPNIVTYADSLKAEAKPRFRRNEEKYKNTQDWLASGLNINHYKIDDYLPDLEKGNNNRIDQNIRIVDRTEDKPLIRRNEERYESDYDNSFFKEQPADNDDITVEEIPKIQRNENRYDTENNNWSKHVQGTKNMRKQDVGNASKQNSEPRNNNSNKDNTFQYSINEDEITKDNRYVINKLKQDKKKNGYINSDRKQKRKNKFEKWNMKGEYGEKYEPAETPEDFVLNFHDKKHNFDYKTYINNVGLTDQASNCYKDVKCKSSQVMGKEEKNEKKGDYKERDAGWFEKRAVLRTEARKKYYAQLKETSPNNSSWYFRRMRKREQCRARADNSTSRNIHKEKKKKH